MNSKKLFLLVSLILIFSLSLSYVSAWDPRDNITLRNRYSILDGVIANFTTYYGNGSQLTGVTTSTANSTTWWAGVSGWVSGWFIQIGNNLDFNGTRLVSQIGNWTEDKPGYYTGTQTDTLLALQDECSEISGCVENAVTNSTMNKSVEWEDLLTVPSGLDDGDDDTTYTNGSGISLVGTQFNHSDTSSQASDDNSGNTFIQDVILDGFGHVTSLVNAAIDFSSYYTSSQIDAFNYYNSTDFSISDYFTKTNILNFGYYNSTDFSISNYPLTSALVGLLGNWSADKGDYWNMSTDLGWENLSDYPVACPGGTAITQLDDSVTCTSFGDASYQFGNNNFNGSGNITITGSVSSEGITSLGRGLFYRTDTDGAFTIGRSDTTPTAGDDIGSFEFALDSGGGFGSIVQIVGSYEGVDQGKIRFRTKNTTWGDRLSIYPNGNILINDLIGSYSNGEAYVCVYDDGTIFAKDSACS